MRGLPRTVAEGGVDFSPKISLVMGTYLPPVPGNHVEVAWLEESVDEVLYPDLQLAIPPLLTTSHEVIVSGLLAIDKRMPTLGGILHYIIGQVAAVLAYRSSRNTFDREFPLCSMRLVARI